MPLSEPKVRKILDTTATRGAALIALRIAQPIRLGIEQGVQRASTVPRTTRSRWLLIRSSSIVMTVFSGLGVSSDMAAPSRWAWLRLATSSSARFGAASLT